MTTINPEFLKQVAGAGGGQGLPAEKIEFGEQFNPTTQENEIVILPRKGDDFAGKISAPPAHPPHVSMAPALKQ